MQVIIDNWPALMRAFGVTLQLLGMGALGSIVLGNLVALLRISPVASLRWIATLYTEIVRNTPLTLVFFFFAIVLPTLQIRFDYLLGAGIALSIYTSPFIAEALRSGINGVPIGQAEAARSLGLSFGQTVTSIVFPQAIRMVVAPLINVIIALTKNTSVAAGFYVVELVAESKVLANAHGDQVINILVAVACLYLVITIPLGQLAGVVERKVAVIR
ncbi:amino acid ABC transporter permease [Tessaracoccus flavus]|uniref:Amino acid ABC transporter permease n=1 Tax=Tessaracoccus flavus TaxID=1610493 RepID=A0A1Q2CDC9_9ACTN|nr:amino acid ABC transporter permease [Tessaracoccus flavus]AQP44119.1 amino acid ABC transporter permease [Tessaracoccus flavus]SDY35663.1 amino acid ABC transporter membrane protein 1, PAAT family [Tessaracoccus flavus]